MDPKISIEKISIQGFRAYLKPQHFELHRGSNPLCLAIYAPNAKGKSSMADAFEFYFSDKSTLSRLGERAVHTNAGRSALENVNARFKGVQPEVHFYFREGSEHFDDARVVVPTGNLLPSAANRVLEKAVCPFLIRGHELRRFVEDITPEERYNEFAKWFGLGVFLPIQKNLRALRKQVKARADSTPEQSERLRDLATITANAVEEWDNALVCRWFNESVLSRLGTAVTLASMSRDERGYRALERLKKEEEENLGLSVLNRFLDQINSLYPEPKVDERNVGEINTFEEVASTYIHAQYREAEVRTKISEAVFNDVWAAAKKVVDNGGIVLEVCPVCDTALSATLLGSRAAVSVSLDAKLLGLADYQKVTTALEVSKGALERAFHSLVEGINNLVSSTKNTRYCEKTDAIVEYGSALELWNSGEKVPSCALALVSLSSLRDEISCERARIEAQQGEHTFAEALRIADRLIELNIELERIDRFKRELNALKNQLEQLALLVNKAIAEYAQNVVGALTNDVNLLYKEIQGGDLNAPPIRLELPNDDGTNQQRIGLVIDFARNRKGVVPSGYLSDSQIHTLALSLRLAAIRMLNTSVPIVVLDDVVTSYDADHRKNIATMLSKFFADYQIILLTHDERFFNLLQDHLSLSCWEFSRIVEIDPGFGPRFVGHRTSDEVIQSKLDKGESAANEIRQSQEEWLLDICRAFGVKVVIRPIDRPYKYDRSELASALAAFLAGAKLEPPKVIGLSNSFLVSLQKGNVENFGSHFSDNPHENASIGDERTRWLEFKQFRDHFRCSSCGKSRFVRPIPLVLPVCVKCNTPFQF